MENEREIIRTLGALEGRVIGMEALMKSRHDGQEKLLTEVRADQKEMRHHLGKLDIKTTENKARAGLVVSVVSLLTALLVGVFKHG